MHIAVIIPAYNAAAWLADCLGSLRAQIHTDWSAFVVDDGSADDTAGVAQRFGDPRIRLLRQTNAGVSAARNRGIRHALGHNETAALLFLDADDWLAPTALQRLACALSDAVGGVAGNGAGGISGNGAGAVAENGADGIFGNGADGISGAGVPITAQGGARIVAAVGGHAVVAPDGTTRVARLPPGGALLERLLVRNLFINGGQILICRQAVAAVGLFNTDLAFGEDWDYWSRLAAVGEFAVTAGRAPVLFARERGDSAYRRLAIDPGHNGAAIAAIYANPVLAKRHSGKALTRLRRKAEADSAWIAGRELIRHGRPDDGWRWLLRSWIEAPGLKRAGLLLLARLRLGPFRRYRFGAPPTVAATS